MKKLILFLLLAPVMLAQAPANSVLLGPEGVTITSTTGTGVIYMFGAVGKFNTVTSLKLPFTPNCGTGTAPACTSVGGDPAPGFTKSIYAVEQATAYTVTVRTSAGVTSVINVPALPVVTPPPPTGPATTATVAPPDSTYRLSWCKTVLNTTTNQFTIVCNAATAGQ